MAEITPYYYGSAPARLNSKGQVAIPARLRSVVPEEDRQMGFVLIRGSTSCLFMYTHKQFSFIKNNARKIAESRGDAEFYRRFLSEAFPVDIDNQGRFVLPADLRKVAEIDGADVLFIGLDDRIEIWNPEKRKASDGIDAAYEKLRQDAATDIFGI